MFRFKDENKNKTVDSLRKFPNENAYEITYYGDYAMDEYLKCGAASLEAVFAFESEYLYEGNSFHSFSSNQHGCSGFTAYNPNGDFLVYHNLDNRVKLPAVTMTESKVTGKTIGIGCLAWIFDFNSYDWEKYPDISVQKPVETLRVLSMPYRMYDGMNAYGLSVVVFTAGGTEIRSFGDKIPLFDGSLYFAIVDRCKNVDDAIAFLHRFSQAPLDNNTHFQIADASGKSIIVEYVKGEMVITPNEKPYQVCSNFLIYGNPEMEGFGKDRYLAYQEYLDAHDGIVDEDTAFRLLHENHIPGDENYSVVFNLTKRTAAVEFAPNFAVRHRYQL